MPFWSPAMAPTKSTIGVLARGIFLHSLPYFGLSNFFVLLKLHVRPLSSVLLLIGIFCVNGGLAEDTPDRDSTRRREPSCWRDAYYREPAAALHLPGDLVLIFTNAGSGFGIGHRTLPSFVETAPGWTRSRGR